ncbi:MAG: ribonuclease III, partial [Puniceicoccales bacterium]|nr:ribonuclease III [Puniceicoccales bacterium]
MPHSHATLQQRIAYTFHDPTLLQTALTHPSIKGHTPAAQDYQRLEFLGDAVLGLIFAETLYATATPNATEGALSEARAHLARGSTLATAARRLHLAQHLHTTPHGDTQRIRNTDTASEDALEALFGALYLDGGLDAARTLARQLFATELQNNLTQPEQNRSPKNRLQEHLQQTNNTPPPRIEYRLATETGPPHARHFTMQVWVNDTLL